MKYIVRITENSHSDYIADGSTYYVNGNPYVPVTSHSNEAKRYKTKKLAESASQRTGENMHGLIEIVEVEE